VSAGMSLEARVRFRDELKAARARTLRNAEGFAEVVRTIERLARFRGATGNGMGSPSFYSAISAIASESPLSDEVPHRHARYIEPFAVLYESTRLGRNLSVHEGAYARNVARHAVELALILEDAMQTILTMVQHFMVRSPVCAEPWEPLSLIRNKMLVNSFSFLPFPPAADGEWQLVSDAALASYLRSGKRKDKLKLTLEEALQDGFELRRTRRVEPTECVENIVGQLSEAPVIVATADKPGEILGVLTAFDLL
jgi:hypothetical protein